MLLIPTVSLPTAVFYESVVSLPTAVLLMPTVPSPIAVLLIPTVPLPIAVFCHPAVFYEPFFYRLVVIDCRSEINPAPATGSADVYEDSGANPFVKR